MVLQAQARHRYLLDHRPSMLNHIPAYFHDHTPSPTLAHALQLCVSLTAHVVCTTGFSVAYVCGSCDFSASRLEQIMLGQQSTEEFSPVTMEKVRVFKTFTVFDLLATLQSLQHDIALQVHTSYHWPTGI